MAEWLMVMVTRPTCKTRSSIAALTNHTLQLLSVMYPPYSCPDNVVCSEQEVCDLLTALDVTKASGQDSIYISQDA